VQSLVEFDPTHPAAAHGTLTVTLVVAAESMGPPLASGTVLIIASVHAAPLTGSASRPLCGAH